MDDLISRQAAIDALNGEIEITGRTNAEAVKGYVRLVKDRLERLPSAQLERKKGEWIPVTNGRGGFECDQCHNYAPSYQDGVEWLSGFCPNCGAKMDEEIEGRKK